MHFIKGFFLYLLISISAVLISGCSAKGLPFSGFKTPKDNSGIVYLYRVNQFIGGALSYDIFLNNSTVNNALVGELLNGGFEEINLPIGENKIRIKAYSSFAMPGMLKSSKTVVLDIKNGEVYCLKNRSEMSLDSPRPILEIVDIATCKSEIATTKKIK